MTQNAPLRNQRKFEWNNFASSVCLMCSSMKVLNYTPFHMDNQYFHLHVTSVNCYFIKKSAHVSKFKSFVSTGDSRGLKGTQQEVLYGRSFYLFVLNKEQDRPMLSNESVLFYLDCLFLE